MSIYTLIGRDADGVVTYDNTDVTDPALRHGTIRAAIEDGKDLIANTDAVTVTIIVTGTAGKHGVMTIDGDGRIARPFPEPARPGVTYEGPRYISTFNAALHEATALPDDTLKDRTRRLLCRFRARNLGSVDAAIHHGYITAYLDRFGLAGGHVTLKTGEGS